MFKHRKRGYKLLTGRGLEIGALHESATLPSNCKVEYADVITKEQAIINFPEIDKNKLVNVDHICNIDKDGLQKFENETFDFVIFSHVIEHLANPIQALEALFRVTKFGGMVLIVVPDKRFTFDKDRGLTPFEHLKEEYINKISDVSDEHYLDFLNAVHPDVMKNSKEAADRALNSVRKRREHAHVWDSNSFKQFLLESFSLLNINYQLCFENTGDTNKFEYFSIWKKVRPEQETISTFKPKGILSIFNK